MPETQNCLNDKDLIQKCIENKDQNTDIDIKTIIDTESITSHFQQIFSIKSSLVVGVEALARGIDPFSDQFIPPYKIFGQAEKEGLTLELDRLCRKVAIREFASIASQNPNLLLFVNLDTSTLVDSIVGSNNLLNAVRHYGLDPSRVVIEFIESKTNDQDALLRFIKTYREQGFLFALDDMGAGHSNLERIPIIKPDIIKLDRSLIKAIDREYYKQELFEFFIKLAHKIGFLVIAEGIETQEESLACLERGADLVQGFYFAFPKPIKDLNFYDDISRPIEIRDLLKTHLTRRFADKKKMYSGYYKQVDVICESVRNCQNSEYEKVLHDSILKFLSIDCIYILHESGIQLSDTVCNPSKERRKKNALFSPNKAGTDQSSKDYYIYIDEIQTTFVTDPYISLASGITCVTISKLVRSYSGQKLIVCIDFEFEL